MDSHPSSASHQHAIEGNDGELSTVVLISDHVHYRLIHYLYPIHHHPHSDTQPIY